MHNLEWTKSDKPDATHEHLDKIEAELGVKIPEMLRKIVTTFDGYPPTRNGEMAEVVTQPNDPEFVGFFAQFMKPYIANSNADWLDEQFDFRPEKVIGFGSDGASAMLLCYDNDPTNANPEIRNVWHGSDTLDAAWDLFAPDFETLICNLKTESEAYALGLIDPP